MKVQKLVKAQGEFAKVGTDVSDGDKLTVLDEGQIVSGDYGDKHVFKVKTAQGDEKNLTFNQTSMNNLIDAYSDDTSEWIGKKATVFVVKQRVGDELKNIIYLVGKGYTMDDRGKFVKSQKEVD